MRRLSLALTIIAMLLPASAQAAPLEIVIFLSSQKLMILEDGETTYEFTISSGKEGKRTPTGVFTPTFLSKHHRSSLYQNAPMPNSIFFNGHIALHGTDQEWALGTIASNGCIRLSLEDSYIPFALVEEYGIHNTEIRVVG